jgi:hypothetical protein
MPPTTTTTTTNTLRYTNNGDGAHSTLQQDPFLALTNKIKKGNAFTHESKAVLDLCMSIDFKVRLTFRSCFLTFSDQHTVPSQATLMVVASIGCSRAAGKEERDNMNILFARALQEHKGDKLKGGACSRPEYLKCLTYVWGKYPEFFLNPVNLAIFARNGCLVDLLSMCVAAVYGPDVDDEKENLGHIGSMGARFLREFNAKRFRDDPMDKVAELRAKANQRRDRRERRGRRTLDNAKRFVEENPEVNLDELVQLREWIPVKDSSSEWTILRTSIAEDHRYEASRIFPSTVGGELSCDGDSCGHEESSDEDDSGDAKSLPEVRDGDESSEEEDSSEDKTLLEEETKETRPHRIPTPNKWMLAAKCYLTANPEAIRAQFIEATPLPTTQPKWKRHFTIKGGPHAEKFQTWSHTEHVVKPMEAASGKRHDLQDRRYEAVCQAVGMDVYLLGPDYTGTNQVALLFNAVANIFSVLLQDDYARMQKGVGSVSGLSAKWAPSSHGYHAKTTMLDRVLANHLPLKNGIGMHYCKFLKALREAAHVPESRIGAGNLAGINYHRVASLALVRYNRMFESNPTTAPLFAAWKKSKKDKYNDSVARLEAAQAMGSEAEVLAAMDAVEAAGVATGAVEPWTLVRDVLSTDCPDGDEMIDMQFAAMVASVRKAAHNMKDKVIVMSDVSGSMMVSQVGENPKPKNLNLNLNPDTFLTCGAGRANVQLDCSRDHGIDFSAGDIPVLRSPHDV